MFMSFEKALTSFLFLFDEGNTALNFTSQLS